MIGNPLDKILIDCIQGFSAEKLHQIILEVDNYASLIERQIHNGGAQQTQCIREYELASCRSISKLIKDLMMEKLGKDHNEFLIK